MQSYIRFISGDLVILTNAFLFCLSPPGELLSTRNVLKKKNKIWQRNIHLLIGPWLRDRGCHGDIKKKTQTTLKTKQGLSSFCNWVCCKTRCQTSQRTERPWVMHLHWGSYGESLNAWSVWENPAVKCNDNRILSCTAEPTCLVSVLAAHTVPELQLRHKANGIKIMLQTE